MQRTLLLMAGLALSAGAMAADDIDSLQNLGQAEFRDFSEDLGAALSYKALAPAEPLGIVGFDIGFEVTSTSLENSDVAKKATGGSSLSALPIPKVHIHKGLPANIDVGAFYGSAPGTNVELMGAELRWAFVEGGVAVPAVALRGTWSSLSGVDQLALDTTGLELTISKGFTLLTPYAGAGRVWVDSSPDVSGLKDESFELDRYYAGLNIGLGLMNLAVEADQTGDASSYGVKIGTRF